MSLNINKVESVFGPCPMERFSSQGHAVREGAPRTPSAEFYQEQFPRSYEALFSNSLTPELAMHNRVVPVDISRWGEHFKWWTDLVIAGDAVSTLDNLEAVEELFNSATYYTGFPSQHEVSVESSTMVDSFKPTNLYGFTVLEGTPVDTPESTPSLIFRGLNLRPVYTSEDIEFPFPFYYNLSSGQYINQGEYVPPIMQRRYMTILEHYLGRTAFYADQISNPHLYDIPEFSHAVVDFAPHHPFNVSFASSGDWLTYLAKNAAKSVIEVKHIFSYDPYLLHYFTRYDRSGYTGPGIRIIKEAKAAKEVGKGLLGHIYSQVRFLINYEEHLRSDRRTSPIATSPELEIMSY